MSTFLTKREQRQARWIGIGGSRMLFALGATWRTRVLGAEHEQACLAAGCSFIYTFWHGRLLPLTYLRSRRQIVVLVSHNRDGEYIAQVIHRMGFATVRGSSSRGGVRALLEMARHGVAGAALAFTPDGPRGPRARAQPGVVVVAQRAGIPILPMSVSAWPRRLLSSWDQMLIPWPFARIVLTFGPPLHIAGRGTPEEIAAEWTPRVEGALNAVTAQADREVLRWVGRESRDER